MSSWMKKNSLRISRSTCMLPPLFRKIQSHVGMCPLKRWTSEVTSSSCVYGKIPHDHWFQPDWIDEEKATASRLKMIKNNVCCFSTSLCVVCLSDLISGYLWAFVSFHTNRFMRNIVLIPVLHLECHTGTCADSTLGYSVVLLQVNHWLMALHSSSSDTSFCRNMTIIGGWSG